MIERDPETRSGRRRSRRRRRMIGWIVLGSLVAGGIASGALLLPRRSRHPAGATHTPSVPEQVSVLFVLSLHDDVSQHAESLTVFGIDEDARRPAALFVPAGTLGQIPGQGFEEVGKALSVGDPTLQRLTVENVLGIAIDRTVVLDDVTLAALIDAAGGVEVNVQERLEEESSDGTRTLAYPLGTQHLSGPEAVTYLTFRNENDSEIDRFVRARKVWDGLFAAGREAIDTALRASLDASDVRALADVFGAFARARPQDRAFQVLPVESVGGGGLGDAFRVDERRMVALIEREFAGSIPAGIELAKRPRVEIRNGNGEPEAGQRAAEAIVPAGFKIEVTGNAPRFDFPSTRIIVYAEDEESLALARKARDLLGVGKIEVGTRGQTVVDVTIVLGQDFTDRKE